MDDALAALFTPVQVGRLTLKNRIYSSGHAEAMAEDGRPTARLTRYHEAKARGGCALTIFGGSSSVHPSSPAAAWKQIANHDDSVIPGYQALADAVHRDWLAVITGVGVAASDHRDRFSTIIYDANGRSELLQGYALERELATHLDR